MVNYIYFFLSIIDGTKDWTFYFEKKNYQNCFEQSHWNKVVKQEKVCSKNHIISLWWESIF